MLPNPPSFCTADLGMDPLELRLRNHAATNPQSGKPWSSKGLLDCYRLGAEMFGWQGRLEGGTMRPDGRLRGFGMSTAFDLGRQFPASARVGYRSDGSAFAEVTTAEIGQGLHGATFRLQLLAAEKSLDLYGCGRLPDQDGFQLALTELCGRRSLPD